MQSMIEVTILNPNEMLYGGQAESVVLPGDSGDFEVLSYHKPVIALLRPGQIVLDGHRAVEIRRGVARAHLDRLVALVEQ